jgi:hypothetical protein
LLSLGILIRKSRPFFDPRRCDDSTTLLRGSVWRVPTERAAMPVIRIEAEQAKKGRNKESPGRNRSSSFAGLKLLRQMVRLPNSEFPGHAKIEDRTAQHKEIHLPVSPLVNSHNSGNSQDSVSPFIFRALFSVKSNRALGCTASKWCSDAKNAVRHSGDSLVIWELRDLYARRTSFFRRRWPRRCSYVEGDFLIKRIASVITAITRITAPA